MLPGHTVISGGGGGGRQEEQGACLTVGVWALHMRVHSSVDFIVHHVLNISAHMSGAHTICCGATHRAFLVMCMLHAPTTHIYVCAL